MKRSVAVVAALLMASVAMGQENNSIPYFSPSSRYLTVDLCKVQRSYLYTLESENNGVVESGIAHVMRMKLALPTLQCEQIEDKLAELAQTGRTPAIRYKAYLAGFVYADAQQFVRDDIDSYVTPEEMFSSVATQVQQLAFNGNSR